MKGNFLEVIRNGKAPSKWKEHVSERFLKPHSKNNFANLF